MVEYLTTASGVLDYWHKTFLVSFQFIFCVGTVDHISLFLSLSKEVNREKKQTNIFLQTPLQGCYREPPRPAPEVIISASLISKQGSRGWLCLPFRFFDKMIPVLIVSMITGIYE